VLLEHASLQLGATPTHFLVGSKAPRPAVHPRHPPESEALTGAVLSPHATQEDPLHAQVLYKISFVER
jgi:hypothetical protein